MFYAFYCDANEFLKIIKENPKNFKNLSSGLIQSPIQKWALDVGFLEEVSPDRWSEAMAVVSEIGNLDYEELAEFFFQQATGIELSTPCIEILKCMRGSVLSAIMRLMISDPYYWGGGQPDLILWNTIEKSVCFAEVKGPGDQLAPRQRWWLAYLRDSGATSEVCWVVDEPKEKPVRKREPLSNREKPTRKKKVKESASIQEVASTISTTDISQTFASAETIILSSQTDVEIVEMSP
jgi:hypothetical protein